MKVVGIDKAKFLAVVTAIGTKNGVPGLQWKDGQYAAQGSGFQGYLSIKGWTPSTPMPFYQVHASNGQVINKPCAHLQAEVVRAVFDQCSPAFGAAIWAEKNKVSKGNSYGYIRAKVQASLKGKGYICQCDSLPTSNTMPVSHGTPVAKVKVAVHTMIETQPVMGAPVYDGTGSADVIKKGHIREAMAACTGLYVLQEIGQELSAIGILPPQFKSNGNTIADLSDEDYHAVLGFWVFKAQYERTLARNLFDYLTIACVGEMRHQADCVWPDGQSRPQTRTEAYTKALAYDPRTILPIADKVFSAMSWGGGFGGKKWAKIASSAALYFKFVDFPVVFADHVVDLAHNGGIAFDKGYVVKLNHSASSYLQMLDRKRTGSLLQWAGHNLHIEPEVLSAIIPILRGILAPKYRWQSDPAENAAYAAWDALYPEPTYQAMAEGAERTVSYHKWARALKAHIANGQSLGFVVGEPPSCQMVCVGGFQVTAKFVVQSSPDIPALTWGDKVFTMGVKEMAYMDAESTGEDEAVDTPTSPKLPTVAHFHTARGN